MLLWYLRNEKIKNEDHIFHLMIDVIKARLE